MTARSEIMNEALVHLGEPLSVGVDDDATLVQKMASLYPARAKLFLEAYPWNFAGKVAQLSASEPTPDDWAYGYNKPSNCRRILKVDSQADMRYRPGIEHEVRGNRILANSDTVWCRYVDGGYADLEGSWPQHPQTALAWDLADLLAPSIDLSNGKIEWIAIQKRRSMTEARLWDAQQNPPERAGLSRWQRNHLGGYGDRRNAR